MKIHIMFRRGHLLYIRQTDMTQGTQIYIWCDIGISIGFKIYGYFLFKRGQDHPRDPWLTYYGYEVGIWTTFKIFGHLPHESGQVHPRDHKLHTIWCPSTEATRIYMVVGFESYPWLDIWSFLGPGVEWGWP